MSAVQRSRVVAPRAPRPLPKRPEPRPGFVAVGFVRGPHGLLGELKVEPLTDHPQRFQRGASLRAGDRTYTVRSSRMHQKTLLLQIEGIDTRGQAETLRDLLLEIPETELPALAEGEYYRYQLMGMEVVDRDGQSLGRIEEVLDTGANDVYAVRNSDGELLLPAIDTVVKQVDVAAGRMVVEVPAGLERRPPAKRRLSP
jgi:16S rRNA processing protein RimM